MENKAFQSQAAVIRYLVEQGFRVNRSVLSYHVTQGHLARVDGLFPVELVKRFAKTYLKNASTGAGAGTAELVSAKELKTRLEAEKLQEQVHMAKLQRERLEGKLISREEVYLELAARAVVLDNGLTQMFQIKATEIIELVEGNPARYPELIDFLQREIDELMNGYAKADEFEVMFEEAAAGIEKNPNDTNLE